MGSKSELIALLKELKTDAAIARKLKITRQSVYEWRRIFGIEASTAKIPERNKKMIAMYKGGMSGTALAKKFDLSVAQTSRILARAKRKKHAHGRIAVWQLGKSPVLPS